MGTSDDFVSPYLLRPLRRYEEALRDRLERRSPDRGPAAGRGGQAHRPGDAASSGRSDCCRDTGGETECDARRR